jgi:hypothetical protein
MSHDNNEALRDEATRHPRNSPKPLTLLRQGYAGFSSPSSPQQAVGHSAKENKWLHAIPPEIGNYFAGFVDGEGSFSVSLRKRNDYTLGWQIVLTFNVSQRDVTVLALMKKHLGCGRLQERSDGVWYFVVSNPTAIEERIIPFFKKYSFLSASKKKNFSLFRQIAKMMANNEHMRQEGMQEIITLREKLNEGRGRKRKYELKHYQTSLSENPQRLYARPKSRKRRGMI